jgi:thiamine biosynthesis lipoprotein
MVRSETRRLPARAGERVPIGRDLAAVLHESRTHFNASDGTFDPTVGPLIQLWRHARQRGVAPTEGEIAAARRRVGFQHVQVHDSVPPAGTAVYEPAIDAISLDFGGIGQGYGADQALMTLRTKGVTSALVDLSGDIAAGDAPPGFAGWRVHVPALGATLVLSNGALTVSGDEYQHMDSHSAQGGTLRLGHIVDPRTGMALQSQTTVVVLAPRAVDADALATWLSVQGPSRGTLALRRFPGARAAWVTHPQFEASNVLAATSVVWSSPPPNVEASPPHTPPQAGP